MGSLFIAFPVSVRFLFIDNFWVALSLRHLQSLSTLRFDLILNFLLLAIALFVVLEIIISGSLLHTRTIFSALSSDDHLELSVDALTNFPALESDHNLEFFEVLVVVAILGSGMSFRLLSSLSFASVKHSWSSVS